MREGPSFRACLKESDHDISKLQGFMANCDKEGNALMQTNGKRETRPNPQSWGNLALADESLGVLQKPKAKTPSPWLSVVQDITEEEVEVVTLAPTAGIIIGIRLSLMLWGLIGLIILLMR